MPSKNCLGSKPDPMSFIIRENFRKCKKRGMKMSEYLKAMKKIADNLTLAGHPISLEDLVSQVLTGLDYHEYNPVVCQIQEKDSISWLELQAKLLSYEKRLEQMNAGIASINLSQPIASYVSKGRNNHGTFKQHQLGERNVTGNYQRGNRNLRGKGGGRYGSNSSRPICQVCGKIGHTAAYCYYKFNNSYMGTPPTTEQGRTNQIIALIASPETVIDPAWYADSGASNHVTNDLNNLQQKSEYTGRATLTVGNGEKLNIHHTGNSCVTGNNDKKLMIKDILHVPNIEKNLLSVSQLIAYNDVVVEFDSYGCVVKDKATGEMVLQGRLKDGPYQMELPSTNQPNSQVQP